MCGICGYFGTDSGIVNPNAIEEVFAATEQRGTDASGYVASVHDRLRSRKLPIKSSALLMHSKFGGDHYMTEADTWIGHCRLATHGSPKNSKNNHPFVHKGLGLIHNGMLMNYHYELEDDKRLNLEGECDSEAILKLITYHRSQGMKTSDAIGKAATEIDGSMACALINREGAMWLFRRDDSYSFSPLWLGYNDDKKLVQFASTHELLKKGLDNSGWTVYNIPSGVGYLLRPSLDGPDFSVTPFEVPDCDNENMSTQWYSGYGAGFSPMLGRSKTPIYTKNYTEDGYKRSNNVNSQLEEDVAEAQVNSAAADNGEETFGFTYTKKSLKEMQVMGITTVLCELEPDDILWCFKCDDDIFVVDIVEHHIQNAHCLFMVESWAEALAWETSKGYATKDVKSGATTALNDYCRGCERLYVPGEQEYMGMCAQCAYYVEDGGLDPAWECS